MVKLNQQITKECIFAIFLFFTVFVCAAHIVAPRFPLPPLTVMFLLDGQLYTVSRVLTHVHHTRQKFPGKH